MSISNQAKKIGLGLAFTGIALSANAAPKNLDMLILYTPEALQTIEGRDINARVNIFIEYFNRTLKNSNVDFRARVVHSQSVNWLGDLNGAYDANLRAVTNDDRVSQLRDKYGADIVSVVYKNPPRQSCGLGWIASGKNGGLNYWAAKGNSGFNLSAVNCYDYIVAHETGHNMGLRHSIPQDDQQGYSFPTNHWGTFKYSRGYGEYNNFHTPMAYPSAYGAPWNSVQPIFSNPRKNICGGQLGTQRACGQAGMADAAGALNQMSSQILSYRPTRVTETTTKTTITTRTTTPTEPTQPIKPVKLNMVSDFSNVNHGWKSIYSNINLGSDHRNRNNNVLYVQQANHYWAGAYKNVTETIKGGNSYDISLDAWIFENKPVHAYLYVVYDNNKTDWIQVINYNVPSWRWTTINNQINIAKGQVKRAELYLYAPGSSYFVDNVRLAQR
ncbi:carbohydrate binding domain-containing protein [Endozoicomonas sp. SM1973]|uniref:Carbohydrate binding domain-containing protein n=1 Tax=Spartinivicinus marinus TaxID=2994442 RepID=A0A853I6I4_9GAMM|nr:M57 family metalloprotease [Spartinivicinus marinus]MCX4028866.1 M57 family metalloprotease [Spartinivicinus marinus]NYZ65551.1 carbohydrate binding domain-containing protein [Spartinivicinus marinus]